MHAALEAGAAGIILQGTGSGNANRSLCSEVAAAVASGVVVVTSTRVDAGPVVPIYGAGGGGEDLRAAGAIGSGHLRPSQSLILLSLLLRTNPDRERITEIFTQRGRPPEPPG
jgi:L-asparaginase